MRKDNFKTRCKFVLIDGCVLAVFPDSAEDCNHGNYMSYMSIGQHGECSKSMMKRKQATLDQYKDLKNELENIIGYNLDVMNEWRKIK